MSFKICTIGCGGHASRVHGPAYKKYAEVNSDVLLAGCCDLNIEKASLFKEKFNFRAIYTDMKEMLDTEKPDAVCVVVPEKYICSTSIEVMKMGYPVFIEKPPGLNREETLQMIKVAQDADVINQVAFNRRHIPLLKKLKSQINDKMDLKIQSIFYDFYRIGRKEDDFETTAIHGIDAAKSIAGSDYKSVKFTYQEMPHIGRNVANIYLDCIFENGISARLNFCPCSGVVVERVTVHADNNIFFLQTPIWGSFDSPGKLMHIQSGKILSEINGNDLQCGESMFETNGFYEENRAFFENVKQGIKGVDDIKSGLQAVEIAECIKKRESIYHRVNTGD